MIKEIKQNEIDSILKLGSLIKPDFSYKDIGENDKIIVYEENDRIIGFLTYYKNYEIIDLLNIAVCREYQRRGIANKLIDYLTKISDVEKIMLEVKTTNTVAIEFYKACGFTVLRTIKNYYDGVDAYAMEKVI